MSAQEQPSRAPRLQPPRIRRIHLLDRRRQTQRMPRTDRLEHTTDRAPRLGREDRELAPDRKSSPLAIPPYR